jgi:hypothetical protein
MVIDPELLEKAMAAGETLREAELKAEIAKADYHHAVRRLHLGGATLREVASELGISHQRVQQIVQSAGGSWWSRVWRNRNAKPDMACTFCERPPSQVAKLVAGPTVFICDTCVERAERVTFDVAPKGSRARCSFCGERPQQGPLVGAHQAWVCPNCVALCRRIIDERSR